MSGQTVSAQVEISASPGQVWNALTDPELIRKYFFGTTVETTWAPGTPITWSGEYDGNSYQDKGEVVEVVPEQRLVVTHFSPMSGQDDAPENYHRLTYSLEKEGDATRLTLEQDNTPEESVEDFQSNWDTMLGNLKELVERG
jgi:uncharacterized protein YndB with AHSA1/START domain